MIEQDVLPKEGETLAQPTENGIHSSSPKNQELLHRLSPEADYNIKDGVSEEQKGVNSKKKNKAVKVSPVENKENVEECCDSSKKQVSERGVDDVFLSVELEDNSGSKQNVNKASNFTPQLPKSKRARRCSESITRKERSSPPLSSRPRGILKRRGRSLSESHIGSLEECLGEELLDKYGSVEHAVVAEYGCLEGLLEECGWQEEDEEYSNSIGSAKKSVRFSDVEKRYLFMSKTSIVNQLANDDKRAMRMKMKEQKKQMRIERRQAQKNGVKLKNSKSHSGYSSCEDATTTDESEGGEFLTSSSGGETTEEETDTSSCEGSGQQKAVTTTDPESFAQHRRSRGNSKGKKKSRKNNKKVELTNNMIFQLDIEE